MPRVKGVMFGILEMPGPHSQIGRGRRLKIVSVRVRVPVGVLMRTLRIPVAASRDFLAEAGRSLTSMQEWPRGD